MSWKNHIFQLTPGSSVSWVAASQSYLTPAGVCFGSQKAVGSSCLKGGVEPGLAWNQEGRHSGQHACLVSVETFNGINMFLWNTSIPSNHHFPTEKCSIGTFSTSSNNQHILSFPWAVHRDGAEARKFKLQFERQQAKFSASYSIPQRWAVSKKLGY